MFEAEEPLHSLTHTLTHKKNQAEIHFIHRAWTCHRWLHSYGLLNNALTETWGWKGGESVRASDLSGELDDCLRESEQSLSGMKVKRGCVRSAK